MYATYAFVVKLEDTDKQKAINPNHLNPLVFTIYISMYSLYLDCLLCKVQGILRFVYTKQQMHVNFSKMVPCCLPTYIYWERERVLFMFSNIDIIVKCFLVFFYLQMYHVSEFLFWHLDFFSSHYKQYSEPFKHRYFALIHLFHLGKFVNLISRLRYLLFFFFKDLPLYIWAFFSSPSTNERHSAST